MESIARGQFPIVVWREGEKQLWNPIHRKSLKNRPEERVRLRLIEYLLQAGWSRHRISTEEAIPDYASDQLRTDIICYSQSFEPLILAECKAEQVSLTTKTAEQISRYNRNVEAPYLLISNGRSDLWYRIDNARKKTEALQHIPEILSEPEEVKPKFEYWKKRGFAGKHAPPELRRWLNPILLHFKRNTASPSGIQYLQFNKSPTDLPLNHYYHISGFESGKIALSFLNTPYGGTRLIAILNIEGTNRAVAEINLDLIFENERPNSSIYSSSGIQNFDFRKETEELFYGNSKIALSEIASQMRGIFQKYLR